MGRGLVVTHHRNQRVADRIRQELARLFTEEVRDPGVGFVTLTGVDLSPDLRHARVFVSVLGKQEEKALAALRRATPFLRRSLAHRAGLRFTPQLRFFIDSSVSTGFRVESLLREIEEERAVAEPDGEETADDEESR
jgi:ribosome-binding factor A